VDVDEALLTGEPTLQTRRRGDNLLAGSLLGPTAGEMKVTRIGSDTQISHISRLLERAQNARPAQKIWAQRLASHFVWVMFAITALAFTVWWQIAPSKAFSVALAVLVAACPCALSLAIPAAVSSTINALAREGVLVLNPEVLNRLDGITDVVFDKTGTLTEGCSRLQKLQIYSGCTESQALQWAFSLEQGSQHPLASAFAEFKSIVCYFKSCFAIGFLYSESELLTHKHPAITAHVFHGIAEGDLNPYITHIASKLVGLRSSSVISNL
jgi:Cu2+-exporting ATPase